MTPLTTLISASGYAIFFPVIDDFFNVALPLPNFFPLIRPHPSITNSGQLLSLSQTTAFIDQVCSQNQTKPAILPFKPSAKTEKFCRDQSFLLLANPVALSRFLEDKINFFNICQSYHLPLITSLVGNFSPKLISQAQKQFSFPLVLQTHFGWAGNSTYLLTPPTKLHLPPETPVKISPLLPGYTLTVNCCLTRHGLLQSPPALQYTGLKPYTDNPFATVGRQWPSFSPATITRQIKNITERFTEKILIPKKYRGFFGLDFFVNQETVYLLECNPRLTASISLYTQMELASRREPLLLFHLAEFLNCLPADNYLAATSLSETPFSGSELVDKKNHRRQIYSHPLITDPLHPSLHEPF